MFRLFWNFPEGFQPAISPTRGTDPDPSHPTQGPSMSFSTPQQVYMGTSEAGKTVHCPTWNDCPPPPHLPGHQESDGERALLEAALAPGMLSKLLLPYPCIGHYLPPSASAASFSRAPSPDPASRSPPWPSKGPFCRCLS